MKTISIEEFSTKNQVLTNLQLVHIMGGCRTVVSPGEVDEDEDNF